MDTPARTAALRLPTEPYPGLRPFLDHESALLLGRGLPAELAVHFRMSAAALTRTLGDDLQWTVPAHVRHEQGADADLLVLADHPDRPAVQRTP